MLLGMLFQAAGGMVAHSSGDVEVVTFANWLAIDGDTGRVEEIVLPPLDLQ